MHEIDKINVVDGRQLKAGRTILGMTIREMAEAAGINRNSVLRAEALKTLPRFSWAADKIADVLQESGISFELENGQAGVWFASAMACAKSFAAKLSKSSTPSPTPIK